VAGTTERTLFRRLEARVAGDTRRLATVRGTLGSVRFWPETAVRPLPFTICAEAHTTFRTCSKASTTFLKWSAINRAHRY